MRPVLNVVASGYLLLVAAGVAPAQEAKELLESGNAWFDKGNVDKAIRDYSEAIRLDPKIAVAHQNRGSAWFTKGDIDNAIRDYTEALRLDPKYTQAYNNRAVAWWEKGDADNTIRDCAEVIRLDPKIATAYEIRGAALAKKGEYESAIRDCSEAIRLDPNYAKAYFNRATARKQKGDIDNAIRDFTDAIRLDPKDVRPYSSLAWLMATSTDEQFRDGERAVEYAKKACELTGNKDAAVLDTLAVAYAEAEEFERAEETEELALTMVMPNKKAESIKADFRARLELFKAGKPYREERKKK